MLGACIILRGLLAYGWTMSELRTSRTPLMDEARKYLDEEAFIRVRQACDNEYSREMERFDGFAVNGEIHNDDARRHGRTSPIITSQASASPTATSDASAAQNTASVFEPRCSPRLTATELIKMKWPVSTPAPHFGGHILDMLYDHCKYKQFCLTATDKF